MGRSLCAWFVILIVSVSAAFLGLRSHGAIQEARDRHSAKCTPSSCGNIHNISYPFRLKDDHMNCHRPRFYLFCENNVTVLRLRSGGYNVHAINYDNSTIRVVDPGLDMNNCSSIPRYSLHPSYVGDFLDKSSSFAPVTFLKCANPVNSSLYVDTAVCMNITSAASLTSQPPKPKTYGYVKVHSTTAADLEDGCTIERTTAMIFPWHQKDYNTSYEHIHNALVYGFELHFGPFGYLGPFTFSDYRYTALSSIGMILMSRFILGAPFVIWFLIYKWRRRHLSIYSTIEDFLQSDNNFIPVRYSYSNIKNMTSKFKDKLGEGGYGCVFKGKLRSGRFVAIKLLGQSKGNGQDFVNEVATIGRIHHVNVVRLVGYCVEGSKRALVYDFMPNGSLDKYIYSKEGSTYLSYKKIYEISLRVAQGIEYLHQGCDMQILHFDIKPHNILLDENFIPKISDFGLAKLYPTDNSIVFLTIARGTMGYIAPELFYKNIGGVSYKADVYSFGMLLMEMASRRKNLNASVEHSSQIYFPSWVYDQYNEGRDLEMSDVTEEEKKTIRKMVLVALWCIQLKPSDRPSMRKVIKMLEGDVESIRMPEKPFLLSLQDQMPVRQVQNNSNSTCSNELTLTLSAR